MLLHQNLIQSIDLIKEWQQQAHQHSEAIRSQLDQLSESLGTKVSEKAEEAIESFQKGKTTFDYHKSRRDYLQHLRALFEQVTTIESTISQSNDPSSITQHSQELYQIALKSHQDGRGNQIKEVNKHLTRHLNDALKRVTEECCEKFAASTFVFKIYPVLGKLMKQHVLHTSDIEKRMVEENELDLLRLPKALVAAAKYFDETASFLGVNVGAVNKIVKLYTSQIQASLNKYAEEAVSSVLANLKSAENVASLLETFLSKYQNLTENTWALTLLLFSSESNHKYDTLRKFLFQPLPDAIDQSAIQSHVVSVFESNFSELFKKITKKSPIQVKHAMNMLFLMYNFYGDPAGLSYIPLRILQADISKGTKANELMWTKNHLNSQFPLVDFAKFLFKTIDGSPPANISGYFASHWGSDDATAILEKFQFFLRCTAMLAVIAEAQASTKPSPIEILSDFISSAALSTGEVSSAVSKSVSRGMQKFLSQHQSLSSALENKDVSALSSINNFMDYETLAIYQHLLPDVLTTINSSTSNTSSSSRKKSQYQDLL